MTLEQLRIFVGVAEREHVTKAAEALNVTQSAASGAVAALEARYGVPLFHVCQKFLFLPWMNLYVGPTGLMSHRKICHFPRW